MNSISKHLRDDYKRFAKKIPDVDYFRDPLIGYNDVLKAHYLICDYFECNNKDCSIYGVRDFNLLGSALGRQIVSFSGKKKWSQYHEIAATLFFGLVKNHAFHDGNKRTALLILIYQLYKYGRTVSCNKKDFENLTVKVASNQLSSYKGYSIKKENPEISFIADYIRRNTRKIDKRYYPLTFKEFNRCLQNRCLQGFSFFLDNPSGGFIGIYKKEIIKRKFLRGDKEVVKKVFQIGFNGWTKQVRPKAVKEVLKATKLTSEYGVDSRVFYNKGEPMSFLIEEFEGVLNRLKDK